MTKTERIENIVKKLKTRQSKAIIYALIIAVIACCFAYRFDVVRQERNTSVFNIARNNIENGVPVQVLTMQETNGVLYEPLTIKNNRAYVSGGRISTFKSGQKLGDCKIISVSNKIDLDTGMYMIKTAGCSDGMKYVEIVRRGFYVPVASIYGNTLYVMEDGFAHARDVNIAARDAQNALIKSGIKNGDVVILSNIKDNEKIQIVE